MGIADYIEHTLLRPDTSEDQVRLAVMAASRPLLAAVVVPPVWARFAVTAAAVSSLRVCVAVGFPLGTHTASAKGLEARLALEEGAAEVLFVPNLTAFRSGHGETFRHDVAYVVKQCRQVNPDALVKVLLYADLLRPDELREVVRVVQGNGGQFVGLGSYAPQPITPATVRQLLGSVAPGSPVGVLSEVRTSEEARPLLALGIARLATPWGVELVKEAAGE
jgi:deoxyribose-phosphate aldolase